MIQFCQHYLLNVLSFLNWVFLASLSDMRWLKLHVPKFGSSILFHWSYLFLHQYQAVSDRTLSSRVYKLLKKQREKKTNDSCKRWSQELSRDFTNEEVKMDEKHLKCSTLLTITEMQVKTTLRFYLNPLRLVMIKKTKDTKYWRGCGERGTLFHCW